MREIKSGKVHKIFGSKKIKAFGYKIPKKKPWEKNSFI